MRHLVIGTRGSRLAVTQTQWVAGVLSAGGYSCEIRKIKTSGDIIRGSLSEHGGKGLFIKELEDAILEGKIDLAVHSMKDMPAVLPQGLTIAAVTKRADPRDAFVSRKFSSMNLMPKSARVGTASPRRQSQLKDANPEMVLVPVRGNVDTRIEKLARGDIDAIIVAAAGLERLGKTGVITEYIPTDVMIPSVGQGALAIETKKSDSQLIGKLHSLLNHEESAIAVRAERAFLKAIGGDCYTPLAAYAVLKGAKIQMNAYLGSLDGKKGRSSFDEDFVNNAEELGKRLALLLSHKL